LIFSRHKCKPGRTNHWNLTSPTKEGIVNSKDLKKSSQLTNR